MVRVGFGLLGKINTTRRSLHTTLILVKLLEVGETIGYDQTYEITERQWIGTLPIGRWDGWENFNTTVVLVDGNLVPIVATLGLNQVMVALPKKYPVGTNVTFIESTTRTNLISSRLPRIYRLNDTIVSIRNPLLDTINLS